MKVDIECFIMHKSDREVEVSLDNYFFNLSLDLLCVAGFDGYFKQVNPAFNQNLGYSSDELLASPIVNFVHADDRAATLAELEKLHAGAPTVDFENRYRCHDGSYKWLAWKAYPVIETQLIYAIARDITDSKRIEEERKQVEKQLRVSEANLEKAQHIAHIGSWEYDYTTQTSIWSKELYRIHGFDPNLGTPTPEQVLLKIHPDDIQIHRSQIQANLEAGLPCETELRIICKNGKLRYVQVRGEPIFNDSEQLVKFIGTTLDVTKCKQLEIALTTANQNLEQQVAKRTRQLQQANSDLTQINEELQATLEELKIAEEELRQQNLELEKERQRYGDLFDFAPDGYLVTDTKANIQEANQAISALFNLDKQYLINKPLTVFISPEEYQAFFTQLKQLLARPQLQTWELRLQPHHGKPFFAEVTVTSIHNTTGTLVGLRWLVRDITKRKQTEQALRQGEETIRRQLAEIEAIYTTAPIGLCFVDTDLRFVRINEHLADMNGLPASEHIGRTLRDVIPELADQLEPIYRQVINSGEAIINSEVSGTNRVQPGVLRHWLVSYYPLKERDAKVLGVNVMVQEITSRKQTEANLIESEERIRLATTAAELGMWFWNITTDELVWTPKCKTMFGLAPNTEMSYELFLNSLHPGDRQRTHQAVTQALQEKVDYDIEYRTVWPDGSVHWIAAKGRAFYDDRDQPVRMMGTAQDISDRKLAEQERENLLVRAEAAKVAAEKANRIKDEFLAVLSHELRTPLNPILGWAKLLKSGRLNPAKTVEALDIIERNAKLQVELIEDLLDVSRILRGKLTLNVSTVNLESTILAAIDTVHLAAQTKAIEIQTILEPSVGEVAGDPARLQQIFWNFLSNAVKFTPNNGRVLVKLTRVGSMAEITVSDTGKGISPEFLPHLFDYFCQEDSTITRKFGGLGLGLAIARNLTELHGGSISASSPGIGQGATFTVRLPLVKGSGEWGVGSGEICDSVPWFQPEAIPADLSPLFGIKVLVVDDETDSRDIVAFVLSMQGAEVTTASSALSALQILVQLKPDILVSDIGMPEMDGYELVRQIRARTPEQGGQIPAIALTAYAGEFDRRLAFAAGFQSHIPKPVEPEVLATTIFKLVQEFQ